jgi:hypothetical protein
MRRQARGLYKILPGQGQPCPPAAAN